MLKFEILGLIRVDYLEKDKLIHSSINSAITAEEERKRAKGNEIVLIILITIFILLFFARSVEVFITLLISGLVIGAFALIKHYKERRRKYEDLLPNFFLFCIVIYIGISFSNLISMYK